MIVRLMLSVLLIFISLSVYSQNLESYRCFQLGKDKIFLINSKSYPDINHVMYYPMLKPIKVRHSKTYSEETENGRPDIFEEKFIEYVNNKPTGEYSFNTQGALFNSIIYKNYKKNKVISFKDTEKIRDWSKINNKLKNIGIFCE